VNGGAHRQRLLWASTGTKDPESSDVLYIEALAAPGTVNTMPEATLKAFADHGKVCDTLDGSAGHSDEVLVEFAKAGIDADELAARLQQEGAESFARSWKDLID
jgi:transaldolase